MKKSIYPLLMLIALLSTTSISAQQFSTSPEKPKAGDQLVISYDPTGGPLAGTSFDGVAYLYEKDKYEPTAIDLEFSKEGSAMTAKLPIPATAQIVLFSFENGELDKSDDNGGTGYKTFIYKDDRTTPVPMAVGMKSLFYNGYGRYGGVKKDEEKAFNLAKTELSSNPEAVNDYRFAASLAGLATKFEDAKLIAQFQAQVDKILSSKKSTEDDYGLALSIAKALGDKEKPDAIDKKVKERFPNGRYGANEANTAFRGAKTVDEKLKIMNEAKSKYAKSKDFDKTWTYWVSAVATDYGKAEDWANFEKYYAQITDKNRAASVLNSLAWTMSGESIEGEAKNPAKALELSGRSLKLVDEEIKNLSSKPSSYSSKVWRNNMEYTQAMYADTYALLAFKNGKYAEALKYQTIACEKNKFADGEMAERYTIFYEKMNTPQATEQLLAGMIAEGKATSKMAEQHKRLFLANNTVESAYEKYITSLEKEAKANKRKEIEQKIMDENAPAFTLRNLKGEEVSMESLRGKVLVLDFWATWCGPCKASFPGMQMAVDKFANRKDVEFLFIDTWESGDDKAKAAGDFIASKSYTFNVLMDNDNAVVGKFGVSGIPTKFVVDRNGKIRFKSVGFNGNDQELVDELSIMIEIAGGDVTP